MDSILREWCMLGPVALAPKTAIIYVKPFKFEQERFETNNVEITRSNEDEDQIEEEKKLLFVRLLLDANPDGELCYKDIHFLRLFTVSIRLASDVLQKLKDG